MPTDGNIKNMHYDFRVKLNRIDSAAYRDLKIPEVDRKLNEAINRSWIVLHVYCRSFHNLL